MPRLTFTQVQRIVHEGKNGSKTGRVHWKIMGDGSKTGRRRVERVKDGSNTLESNGRRVKDGSNGSKTGRTGRFHRKVHGRRVDDGSKTGR